MRYILAFDDLEKPKLFARYRGKTAKEIYRCVKGMACTKSLVGPATYAVGSIPKELSTGFVMSSTKDVGEWLLGYTFGVGFLRSCYKLIGNTQIKGLFRIGYNIAGLPATCYAKGVNGVLELINVNKLEEAWFGCPVYIFNDNRLWIESNFTLDDAFNFVDNNK